MKEAKIASLNLRNPFIFCLAQGSAFPRLVFQRILRLTDYRVTVYCAAIDVAEAFADDETQLNESANSVPNRAFTKPNFLSQLLFGNVVPFSAIA